MYETDDSFYKDLRCPLIKEGYSTRCGDGCLVTDICPYDIMDILTPNIIKGEWRRAKVRILIERGKPVGEIAERLGVCKNTIYADIRKRWGLKNKVQQSSGSGYTKGEVNEGKGSTRD